MQYFQDTVGGGYWAFGDEMRVEKTDDGLVLFDDLGVEVPELPRTLRRIDSLPEPPEPAPQTVSRFQGREAMWQTPHGGASLFEAAETIINGPDTPASYRRAWADLQEFRRDSEMLIAVATALGLSSTDLDALFVLAGGIKA